MSSPKRANIIRHLQTGFPRGRPLDSGDLASVGVYPELAYRYVQSGWLERLGRGLFMFAGDQLQQEGSLEFLGQRVSGFHVGGKTALAWRGLRHHVPFSETLSLWGPKNTRLPGWFQERFPSRYTTRELFGPDLKPAFATSSLPESPHGVAVSEPERGLLEMLSEVGVQQEIEEARNIMELASSLRMETLRPLLQACRQVKTIRLCVTWAKELGLPWADKAGEMVAGRIGTSRWVRQLRNGHTLILKSR